MYIGQVLPYVTDNSVGNTASIKHLILCGSKNMCIHNVCVNGITVSYKVACARFTRLLKKYNLHINWVHGVTPMHANTEVRLIIY